MNTFANAVSNQTTTTTNGMTAFTNSSNACVDLFYNIGASRGKDIVPAFISAYVENKDVALRIALWARDARKGAGERQLFRNILKYLEKADHESAIALANKVPELGRFDDLLIFETKKLQDVSYKIIGDHLRAGNGLAAKWMPRQGPVANSIRKFFGLTPKEYRKRLVALTKVVETQMCDNDWDNINFSHVPSVAASRYRRAFNRHTTNYAEYVELLHKGDTSVKVNAAAVYPYDVIKGMNRTRTAEEDKHIVAQWASLPNYVGDASILPLVDVSGSMVCPVRNSKSVTCLDVAVSLGLYLSEKNTGKFKDMFLTFSKSPQLFTLKGNIVQRYEQMIRSHWEMNTNLEKAMDKILQVAVAGNVPNEEMPKMLLILSDMQFDRCVKNGSDSAMDMIQNTYRMNGYECPKVVFWNLNSTDNCPVKSGTSGTALVSGFSPSLMTSLLANNLSSFTPENIMLETVMNSRYDY